jgi:hypothetical protein
VLDDHDGAVTAIAADDAKLVTGSADLTVKVRRNSEGPNLFSSFPYSFSYRLCYR